MAELFGELQERKNRKEPKARFSKMSGLQRRRARWGYIFISPWIIGFLLFTLIPMIASLVFSTLDFTLTTPDEIEFIGAENWRYMFTEDERIWDSLRLTFVFGAISMPIGMVIALFLALLLNAKNLIGIPIFRTIFYLPTMVPGIAAIFIWNQFLNQKTGWMNRFIDWFIGIMPGDPTWLASNNLDWLNTPSPIIYMSFTLMGIWGVGNMMLLTLAALQGVPTDLYEASTVDGAGYWRRLWSITLPMISPVIFYNLIIGTVGLMQYYLVPFALYGTGGEPQGWSRFYLIHLFQQAFEFQKMGYGATLAWFLFIIAMLLTLVLFWSAKYWVYYSGEAR